MADIRYRLGLDIGSTTIKVVLLDGEKIVHSEYRRHHSDISGLLNQLFGVCLPQVFLN